MTTRKRGKILADFKKRYEASGIATALIAVPAGLKYG